jgi:hypothetical protein
MVMAVEERLIMAGGVGGGWGGGEARGARMGRESCTAQCGLQRQPHGMLAWKTKKRRKMRAKELTVKNRKPNMAPKPMSSSVKRAAASTSTLSHDSQKAAGEVRRQGGAHVAQGTKDCR